MSFVCQFDGREGSEKLTHGPIITLALGIGSGNPSIETGTWARYSSSSRDRFEGLDAYHDPAWLADLVVIVNGLI